MPKFTLFTSVFLLLTLIGCSTKPEEKEYIFTFQMMEEPKSLYINGQLGSTASELHNYLHAWVYNTDAKGNLVPNLAKDLPEISADKLQYTVTLDPDAKWADGTLVTAADILFSLKAVIAPLGGNPNYRPFFEHLKDFIIDPQNPQKFTIIMKDYFVYNDYLLTNFPILNPKHYDPNQNLAKVSLAEILEEKKDWSKDANMLAYEKVANDVKFTGRTPKDFIGLGPYMLESWVPGQTITLKRNENYWGKKKKGDTFQQEPDKIVYKLMKDANAAELAIKNKILDASTGIAAATYAKMKEDKTLQNDYSFETYDRNSFFALFFNTRPDGIKHKKIFDDVNVRKAFAYITPADEVIEKAMKGYGKRIAVPLSADNKELNKDLALIPYAPEKAAELFAAAGWKDSDGDGILDKKINGKKQDLEVNLSGIQDYQTHFSIIKEKWEKAGVKCNLDFTAKVKDKLFTHDFDVIITGLGLTNLPQDYKQIWGTEGWNTTPATNYTGFGNAESDKLIEQIRTEPNPQKRVELSKQFQKMVYDAQPCIFLWSSIGRLIISKRVCEKLVQSEKPNLCINTCKIKCEK